VGEADFSLEGIRTKVVFAGNVFQSSVAWGLSLSILCEMWTCLSLRFCNCLKTGSFVEDLVVEGLLSERGVRLVEMNRAVGQEQDPIMRKE
jgi:hypothetical protein